MSRIVKGVALSCAVLCAAAGTAQAGRLAQPQFNLANFSHPLDITNKYWPLPAGRHIVFFEESEGICSVDDFVITDQTKQFGGAYAGLTARQIDDEVWLDADCDGGRDVLLETALDWHAQDNAGNIWYFGEDTTEFLFDDQGNPTGSSKEGSWEAGVDGGIAGLVMLANPKIGQSYRQEFSAGVAEDYGQIIGLNRNVSIGLGDFSGCIVTKEWSPLARGFVEHKTYCPNVGLVTVEGFGLETSDSEVVDFGLP